MARLHRALVVEDHRADRGGTGIDACNELVSHDEMSVCGCQEMWGWKRRGRRKGEVNPRRQAFPLPMRRKQRQ